MAKQKKEVVADALHGKGPLRFAHPFFTDTPVDQRPVIPGIGRRMKDYIVQKLEPIPVPQREPTMLLNEIIGQQGVKEIQAAGSICFHAVGDTGNESDLMELYVADAMAQDYSAAHPEKSPAFLFHLGDVDYFDNTDKGYQAQFYIPYKKYPGKIIAIPGNHDGELFKYDGTSTGQKTTLEEFQKNFCQPAPGVPPAAGTIYREMVSQPGVYWHLDAPFIDIIGLYSNVGEAQGFISGGAAGMAQKTWLTKTLTAIKTNRIAANRKALIIATHHPPFSNGGHSGSDVMLADIDNSCKKAGIMPDAVLAAHSHDYQRYTRHITFNGVNMLIPFYVAGGGGRGLSGYVAPADGKMKGDHSYDSSLKDYGYLTVIANAKQLSFIFTRVDGQGVKSRFDKNIIVDLATNTISNG